MYQGLICGVDEVGRGCLFGPVGAGAVVFPVEMSGALVEAGIKDSKKLSAKKRDAAFEFIQSTAIAWSTGEASVEEIDELGIDKANFLAMRRAVEGLSVRPHFLLVDGKHTIPGIDNMILPQEAIVDGDNIEPIISAASIVAKVTRDRQIIKMAGIYPGYSLEKNKGYGTPDHCLALREKGLTPSHRYDFCRKISKTYARKMPSEGVSDGNPQ